MQCAAIENGKIMYEMAHRIKRKLNVDSRYTHEHHGKSLTRFHEKSLFALLAILSLLLLETQGLSFNNLAHLLNLLGNVVHLR